MFTTKEKEIKRGYRHTRIRKKINGDAVRPRLCIHRSHKNLTAQIIDDTTGKILFGLSTLSKDVREQLKAGGNVESAEKFGEIFAAKAQEKGIKKISFDRGGYIYHGRVKAFAESLRKVGLEF